MAHTPTAATPATTTPSSDTGSPTPAGPLHSLSDPSGRTTQAIDLTQANRTCQPVQHIDYISVTWTGQPLDPDGREDTAVARSFAHCDGYEWRDAPHGAMGYSRMQLAQHAAVFSEAPLGAMGVHLQCKGEGCEDIEASERFEGWGTYLRDLLESGGKLSRLDVAFDDTEGTLDLDTIERAYSERAHTSLWRTRQRHYEDRTGRPGEGRTFCWGKGAGKLSLRIYDYAIKHGLAPGTHHVRVELQCRDEAAQAVAQAIVSRGWVAVAELILAHLRFRVLDGTTRRERCPSAGWWILFLNAAKTARLRLPKPVRTIATVLSWVERQVAPALGLARLHLQDGWDAWVTACAQEGKRRLQPHHLALLPQVTHI